MLEDYYCNFCKKPFCQDHRDQHIQENFRHTLSKVELLTLNVKILSEKIIPCRLKNYCKINDIIHVLENTSQFEFSQAKLFFEDRILLNKSTLMHNDIKNDSELVLFFVNKKIEDPLLIFNEIQLGVDFVGAIRKFFKEFINCFEMKKIKILQVGGDISFFCCLSIAYQFSHCYYFGDSIIPSEIFNKVSSNPFFSQINQIYTVEIDKIRAIIEDCELLIVFEQDQWNSIQHLLQNKCITVIASKNIHYSRDWTLIYRTTIADLKFSVIHSSIYFNEFTLDELFKIFNDIKTCVNFDLKSTKTDNSIKKLLTLLNIDSSGFENKKIKNIKIELEINKLSLINEVNINYQEKNQNGVLKNYLLFIACEIIKLYHYRFIKRKESETKDKKFANIFNLGMLSYAFLDINHNFKISALGVHFIYDYIIEECNEAYINRYYCERKYIYFIEQNVKLIISDSYDNIINRSNVVKSFKKLDGDHFSEDLEKELVQIKSIIVDSMISLPNEIPLAGKTTIGAEIAIREIILEAHIFQPLGLAKFIQTFRHELAHRK